MPELQTSLRIVARVRVIPGAITLAERALHGEYWCACHDWHRHDGDDALTCPAEGKA